MSPLEAMRERRAASKNELDELMTAPTTEKRALTVEEDARFETLVEEVRKYDERIDELTKIEAREAAAAEVRSAAGVPEARTVQVNEPDMYAKGGSNSYFRDLAKSNVLNDGEARERLQRHTAFETEKRAIGNTNGAGGSGGEFAPPTWVVADWVNLIRPGRVGANLLPNRPVPAGTSSISYPKLLTGTAVSLQSTQNSALASTDPTTGYVQTSWATIGGKNVMSQQLLDQTAINFDDVITADLAAAYAQQVGAQIYLGTGNGSGINSTINGLQNATIGSARTWTQASPTASLFYSQTAALKADFEAKRLMPATCFLMHPRRWAWFESALDTVGRPLVVNDGPGLNQLAVTNNGEAVINGLAGRLHGLPVYVDPQIPVNLGTGTNQDIVYLLRTDDLVMFESGPRAEAFREPYADSLGILFRLYAYVGTLLNRHTESLGTLTGTGLVTPTFAG